MNHRLVIPSIDYSFPQESWSVSGNEALAVAHVVVLVVIMTVALVVVLVAVQGLQLSESANGADGG